MVGNNFFKGMGFEMREGTLNFVWIMDIDMFVCLGSNYFSF